jgi:hypothetical protein
VLTKPLLAAERSCKAFAVITTLHGSESVHERLGTAISSLLIRSKDDKSPFLRGKSLELCSKKGHELTVQHLHHERAAAARVPHLRPGSR